MARLAKTVHIEKKEALRIMRYSISDRRKLPHKWYECVKWQMRYLNYFLFGKDLTFNFVFVPEKKDPENGG